MTVSDALGTAALFAGLVMAVSPVLLMIATIAVALYFRRGGEAVEATRRS